MQNNSFIPRDKPVSPVNKFVYFLRDRFSLDDDKADEAEIIQSITRNVDFRGTNLWVLILPYLLPQSGLM